MEEAGVECNKRKAPFSEAFKEIQVRGTAKSIMWKQARFLGGSRSFRDGGMQEAGDRWMASIKE